MTATPAGGAFDERLAEIWERHRDTNHARVELLGEAVRVLTDGGDDPETTTRASQAAHQLAGSLGTFGFAEGTRLAREAETILRDPAGGGAALEPIVRALRDIVADAASQVPETPAGATPDALPERVVLLVSDDPTLTGRLRAAAAHANVVLRVAGTSQLPDPLEQTVTDAVLVDAQGDTDAGIERVRRVSDVLPDAELVALTEGDDLPSRVGLVDAGARICIPRDAAPGQIVEASLRHRAPRADTVTTVLAVDDDPLVLDALEVLLARPDRRIMRTRTAEEFWATFERARPDIALIDLNLPGVAGMDLCRAIRADHRLPRVAVLVLTAETASDTVRAAFAAGADDYIAKPFVGPELEARIGAQTERARLLREMTETDQLSGLDNRRRAEQTIDGLIRLASRRGGQVAVAMVDLDRFKRINDEHGHAVGDTALRHTATLLRDHLRGEDVVARWGGEEFLIAMYGSSAGHAAERVRRLLEIVRDEPIRTPAGEEFVVTFSAGVAAYPRDGETLDELWRVADAALYRAKERRDCVVSTDDAA